MTNTLMFPKSSLFSLVSLIVFSVLFVCQCGIVFAATEADIAKCAKSAALIPGASIADCQSTVESFVNPDKGTPKQEGGPSNSGQFDGKAFIEALELQNKRRNRKVISRNGCGGNGIFKHDDGSIQVKTQSGYTDFDNAPFTISYLGCENGNAFFDSGSDGVVEIDFSIEPPRILRHSNDGYVKNWKRSGQEFGVGGVKSYFKEMARNAYVSRVQNDIGAIIENDDLQYFKEWTAKNNISEREFGNYLDAALEVKSKKASSEMNIIRYVVKHHISGDTSCKYYDAWKDKQGNQRRIAEIFQANCPPSLFSRILSIAKYGVLIFISIAFIIVIIDALKYIKRKLFG